MSFFDEADEPEPTPRAQIRRPRGAGRPPRGAGRPPGGSGRPPRSPHEQDVQTRRLIAVGVVVVVVLVLALLIKGCESSAANSALTDYNARVYNLIARSDSNAANIFSVLKRGHLAGNSATTALATDVNKAREDLRTAEKLHAPSQMAAAQTNLVTVMRLRQDGFLTIAGNAQQTAVKSTSKDAVANIAVGTSQLYASDVIYKTIVVPDIAKALNAAAIKVGTGAGQDAINSGQIIDDLGWLNPTWISAEVGAKLTTADANRSNSQPNLGHGHQLDSVSVDGLTLSPTGNTTVPAANALTWTLYFHNSGQTNENQVVCRLSIKGGASETATIPQTTPGEATHCTITLPSAPQKGVYSVTATIERVPVENDFSNNHHTYTVTFS